MKGGIVAQAGDTYMVYWIDNTALEYDMGKKKDERKRREREAEMHAAGGQSCGGPAQDETRHGDRKHGHKKHDAGAAFAGIAAGIARQMGTPIGRQMIAAGLMAAATAIAKHEPKPAARPTPPTPPTPPTSPSAKPESAAKPEPAATTVEPDAPAEAGKPAGTGPFAGDTPEPPRSEANALPPEFAKVIDSVTIGLERLFVGFGRPSAKKDPPVT